jgi:hypothetical protein
MRDNIFKKKKYIFVSFLTIFILLMIPTTHSVEYQQIKEAATVEPITAYSSDMIEFDLKKLREKKSVFSYIDLIKKSRGLLEKRNIIHTGLNPELKELLGQIENDPNLNYSNISTILSDWSCEELLIWYILLFTIGFMFCLFIVTLPIGIILISIGSMAYDEAKKMDCEWTEWVPSPP